MATDSQAKSRGSRLLDGKFGKFRACILETASELWKILLGHAKKVQGRDWRHSWTAMSYSKVWEQKLSIALANAEAVGHQQRAPAVTRRLALGGRMDESGEGVYESSGDGGVDDRA